ncbi:nephrin isoform X1 [Gadus morhua]|uniref:nephrin isoform X1 n=1 Tax=Gadus morhua TaxID=8049 RepID=UPI0011B6FC85|nr:nephrin isoform X1 [Gadus morhua]
MSAETRLQVLFPAVSVRIVAQQERSRVGQTLGLQCLSGSSNPKANVSWILGARRIPGEEQPPRSAAFGGVSVSSSLALPLVPSYNKQRLICQAYSAVLSEGASTFHTLDVMYPPEFSPAQPRLVQVTEEDTAVLPLLVSANPEELTCTWLHHQDTLITDRDILYQWYEDYSLQIRNVTRRHAGKYTVQCTNEEGRRHTTITLDVLYSPGVRPKSAEVRVVLGAMADLICVADANPAAAFSWAWLGEGEMEFEEETMEEEFGVLTIQEVTRAHAGRYQCIADNGIAPPASAEVELVVCFGPEIKKGVQWSKVASRGDGSVEAEVLCRAEGIPPVSFSWDKNNVPMDFENPRYAERTVRDGSFSTSTVVVLNVSALLDYALFTCHASNALGEDSLQIQLVSTNHPDPPSSVGLVGVSYSSVTLEWIPGFNGGLAQSYRIRYRAPHSNSFTYVDVFPLSTAVYTVTNLAPSTTYNFSIAALNAIGESGYEDAASLVATTDDWFVEDRSGSGEDTGPSGLPMYLTSTLSAVAVVLLASNAVGFVLGWRWRQRRLHTGRSTTSDQSSVLDEKKSEAAGSGGTAGDGSGRYESREKINAAAQRTLITDSGSETQSNVYESYGAESQNYYPLRDYRPRLQPYAEETHRPGETAHYRTDHVHYPVHYPGEPPGHEYETVREFGWRPDVPETPALFPPPDPLGCPQQGSRGLRRPADDGLTSRDYELPFELRGELV